MTPTIDWVKFLWLMDGQCEPGLSEYEVTPALVRLADIGKKTWQGLSGADRARWRMTQQESELALPCFASELKLWAESQFLEIGENLAEAFNDETIGRLAEAMEPPTTLTVLRGVQAGGETESLAMALEEPPAVPVKTYQAQRMTTQKRAEWMERILAALCELDPDFDTKSMHGRKVDLLDMCKALVPRYFNIEIGCFEDTALKGRTVFLPGARGTTYYRGHLEAVRLKLGLNSPRPSRITR